MADLQELFMVENAMKPGSDIFNQCLDLLLTEPGGETADGKLPNPSESPDKTQRGARWKTILPFRGNFGDMEEFTRRYPSFEFAKKGVFQNGVASASTTIANLLDAISIASKSKRTSRSACFSGFCDHLSYIVVDPRDPVAQPFDFFDGESMYKTFEQSPYETALMDHTTINVPVDRWLTLCFHRGVRIVEGCFYYHPAAERGWDSKFSWSHLEVLHSAGEINIGPSDDASRRLTYSRAQYRTFVDPSCWTGHSKKYLYEIYGFSDGIASYRAVYVGMVEPERIRFNVPLCSSEDKILITVNSELVTGTYAPIGKYFDQVVDIGKRDVAIEVSRATFEACVSYLVTLSPNADIIGSSIRYIASRNYIDLVDGAKLVRMPALNYSDALAVSMVCALVSFQLRYELTSESVSIIQKAVDVAKYSNADSTTGLFSALVVAVTNLVKAKVSGLVDRSLRTVRDKLSVSTHIPGIVFDVYLEREYEIGASYVVSSELVPEIKFIETFDAPEDPFTSFLGGEVKASAPELIVQDTEELVYPISVFPEGKFEEYVPQSMDDPVAALQDVYDDILPGHSVLDIPNVSEQKRVADMNLNTEFVGKVCVNKDAVVQENLYTETPIRTSAVPQTKTSLTDLMLASSKRNWNKPDLQLVTDVWELADKFVSEFIDNAMIPGAKEILASKEADPTRFNALDYCDWLSTRSETFRNTLMASCPNEILELNMEKYHTILKGRVKQKMSASAQFELPQGQVVVHHDSSTNALFTSVFRTAFNTLDALLRPEYKSAGRISDSDFSKWLTSIKPLLIHAEIVEIDSSKYDKSQGMLAQAIEIVMLRRLGIAPEVLETFKESFVGTVQSRNLGLAFIIAFQRKSGAADTMLGNVIYNYISAGRSVGYEKILFLTGKGDDNLMGVTSGSDVLVSQRMSYIFNLDARVIKNKVPYFSSGYVVPMEDVVLFVPDPLKKVMLLGEINARSGGEGFKLTEEERFDRFQSFRDSVSVYTVPGVTSVVQALVRQRMDVPTADVSLMMDALVRIAKDYRLFCRAVSF